MVKYIQIIPVNTNTVNTYTRMKSTIFGFPLSVFSIQITSVNTNTYHSNIDNTKMDVASINYIPFCTEVYHLLFAYKICMQKHG